METKNLGLIQAMHSGLTEPLNTKMLWFDENINKHKYFDISLNQWVLLIDGSTSGFMKYKGQINLPSDFPTLADAAAGWVYEIISDVTDNDPSKTNTGLEFLSGIQICWNGSTWFSIGDNKFDSSNPITRAVAGLFGVTLGKDKTVDTLRELLYPAIIPTVTISGGINREVGNASNLTINWGVTKNTNPIISISITDQTIIPTGSSQSGSFLASFSAGSLGSKTWTINAATATEAAIPASTTLNMLNKRYWGKFPTFGTLNDAQILALLGSELASTRVQTRNGIDGAGQYLVFAWPTRFGTPSFVINGLPNTAWTKTRSNSNFTNSQGFIEPYDVWMSNTPQNSPITLFQIN